MIPYIRANGMWYIQDVFAIKCTKITAMLQESDRLRIKKNMKDDAEDV